MLTIQQVARHSGRIGLLKNIGSESVRQFNFRISLFTQLNYVVTLSAAWHGGLEDADNDVKNQTIFTALSRAMTFWFSQDFTNPACVDEGGTSACPCGTPGLWNTNWFSNVRFRSLFQEFLTDHLLQIILIPRLIGESCLLTNNSLTTSQLSFCNSITRRAYNRFYAVPKPSYVSGANILDIAKVCGLSHFVYTKQNRDARILDWYRPRDAVKQCYAYDRSIRQNSYRSRRSARHQN
jgi:hypothetical protein